MLVTEKSGTLYQIKRHKTEIKNVPEVYNRGQGGLLDIVHPDYAKNGWIYITYSSTGGRRRWEY
jgi:glucose/arabinose dehydrogenase